MKKDVEKPTIDSIDFVPVQVLSRARLLLRNIENFGVILQRDKTIKVPAQLNDDAYKLYSVFSEFNFPDARERTLGARKNRRRLALTLNSSTCAIFFVRASRDPMTHARARAPVSSYGARYIIARDTSAVNTSVHTHTHIQVTR